MLAATRQAMLSGIPEPFWSRSLEDGSEVRCYEQLGRFFAIAFAGQAGKPASHYRYRTREQAIEAGNEFVASRASHAEYRAKRKAKRKAERAAHVTTLEPGRILVNSWGYDQTNINYYQVISVSPSGRSCVIREIGAKSVDGEHYMTGYCWPLKDHFVGEPMTKRIGEGDSVKIHDWGSWAHPWTPKADRWTAYA